MKCNRLKNLIKNWYMQVQNETMAPARMVAFMEQHIAECEECLKEPEVALEVAKIKVIVMPPSKTPKPKEEEADEEIEAETLEDDEGGNKESSDDDEETMDVYDDDDDEIGDEDELD